MDIFFNEVSLNFLLTLCDKVDGHTLDGLTWFYNNEYFVPFESFLTEAMISSIDLLGSNKWLIS